MTTIDGSGGAGMSRMEEALNNEGVVWNILSKLQSAPDWYAASMISKGWHDAVIKQASKLVLRSRLSLPHLVKVFKHIRVLVLSDTQEDLEDEDLELCAESFENLRSLTLGREYCSSKITNAGILALAAKCKFLEHLKIVHILGLKDSGLRALSTGCVHLRSLALGSCHGLTDAAITAICDFPALVELELFGSFRLFTASGLTKIGTGCPNLLKLRLPDLQSIDQILGAVAKGCPKLQEVSIARQMGNLGPLADCKSLTCLAVEFNDHDVLNDEILPICRANKNLKELLFPNKDARLTNHAVTEIMQGLQLEKFCLAAGDQLPSSTIRCITSCRTLQHLTLENVGGSDALGEIGQSGAGLQSLTLRNCRGLESKELKSLVSLNRDLHRLDLRGCKWVGFKGFSAIAECKHLEALDLSFTKVTDRGLIAIAKGVRNLKELTLMVCDKIRSMEAVAHFMTLETLDVEACQFVSDHSLEILSLHFPRLLRLDVSGTDVTDEGIAHLCRCSLLRILRTAFCSSIKGPGLVRVAKSCLFFEHVTAGHTLDKTVIVKLDNWRDKLCEFPLESEDGETLTAEDMDAYMLF